ncbi:hypothetical protein SAY87_024556 [Trapa incisa]|uniref:Uncharacterized protein n=1 Tax=Trapa incisa TaxID=236973 RepID=A0AAN7GC71_9MYRT|nr:hypothetical protein SAY87_024556 [Trapa incisa]
MIYRRTKRLSQSASTDPRVSSSEIDLHRRLFQEALCTVYYLTIVSPSVRLNGSSLYDFIFVCVICEVQFMDPFSYWISAFDPKTSSFLSARVSSSRHVFLM